MIVKISYEEYENLLCRNGYNDVLAKCHMMNYDGVYIEKGDDFVDVVEVEDVENMLSEENSYDEILDNCKELTLIKEEIDSDAWDDYCLILGLDPDECNEVKIKVCAFRKCG